MWQKCDAGGYSFPTNSVERNADRLEFPRVLFRRRARHASNLIFSHAGNFEKPPPAHRLRAKIVRQSQIRKLNFTFDRSESILPRACVCRRTRASWRDRARGKLNCARVSRNFERPSQFCRSCNRRVKVPKKS